MGKNTYSSQRIEMEMKYKRPQQTSPVDVYCFRKRNYVYASVFEGVDR